MDENARKRKREDDENENQNEDEDEASGSEPEMSGLRTEAPREGMKQKRQKKDVDKKGKHGDAPDHETDPQTVERRKQKADKKAAKQERKKQKQAEKLEKKKQKESNARETAREQQNTLGKDPSNDSSKPVNSADNAAPNGDADRKHEETEDMIPIDGFAENNQLSESTAPTSPSHSNTFDNSKAPSAGSSVSSVIPPEAPTESADQKQKQRQSTFTKPLKPTPEELKQRLQKRLEELRAARHADGLNGKPARNRQELIEARRQREEKRRAHKKEMRQKQNEEEQRRRDEAIAKRFSPRGSGSLLSSPGSPADSITSISNNFSFGRVVFSDGQQADPSLTGFREPKKQRGPQDPASALQAAEAKKSRIASLDSEKRAEIEEKEMWLNAKRRAHGERPKDDISLLKKSLSRKESAKKKSEKQWRDRLDTVAKGKEEKQAKREENLRKRREEKGNKGKKGKTKARPGFEGSFKTKAGKK